MYLEQILLSKIPKIESWIKEKELTLKPIPYISSDIRSNNFKASPVDINMFPACFNNLLPESQSKASQQFQRFFQQNNINSVCIIPENYTRNMMYIKNIKVLFNIIKNTDIKCTIGNCQIDDDLLLQDEDDENHNIVLKKMINIHNTLQEINGHIPDAILLNTDLTSGPIPEIIGIKQPIFPEIKFGWYNRKKSKCFAVYQELCQEFSNHIDIDPWLIDTIFDQCDNVDFFNKKNMDKLAEKTDAVLQKIAEKYKEYNIAEQPKVFIKADNGTHGVGVFVVASGEDVININKKNRHKMSKIKHNNVIDSVIIQEAIKTSEEYNSAPAEYIHLIVNNHPITTIMRANELKGEYSNLNQKGAIFIDRPEILQNNITYNILGKLIALSITRELDSL